MKNSIRWDNLTSPELKKLAQQEAIVLIPVGSTEQHGPHLPVGTDNLLATHMAEFIASQLTKRGTPCIVTPSIAVANSTHHMNFSGSMTLSPATYIAVLKDYCRSVAAHGFRKIFILNGHGGNIAPTQTAIIDINAELGFPVYFAGYSNGDSEAQRDILESQSHMIHACECETSLMLSMDESLVDPMYKTTRGNFGYDFEPMDSGMVYTFHRMESHTENGVMGNSYLATKEKGNSLKMRFAAGMVSLLETADLWKRPV